MKDTKHKLPKSAEFVLRIVAGSHSGRIIDQINIWLMLSGTEWTVSRLKAIWAASLQLRAGNHEVVRCIYRENSISYFHGTLIPRGPMGVLVRGFLNSQRPSSLRKYSAGLRVYTSLTLRHLSAKQYEKARKAITGIPTSDQRPLLASYLNGAAKQLYRSVSSNVKIPDLSRLKAFSSTFSDFSSSTVTDLPYGKAVTSLINTCYIPESLREVNPNEDFRQLLEEAGAECSTPGRISFIQERGAKARVVAVPNAWIQWLFEPLHHYLDRVIKTLPRSAVHDQNKGAYFIRNHMLTERSTMWCFDLSSATDRFPLYLQNQVLEGLHLHTYAEALSELTNGWLVTDSSGSTTDAWDYAAGQPMGLYGSFPLFHLTHYLLLEKLSIECGFLRSATMPFFVLGDDVIITDGSVASLYAMELESLGVEVSPSKTIQSSDVAEFAGFVGLRTNKSCTVFRPYKYGSDEKLNAPLNLMYSLGSSLGKTGPYWDKQVRLFGRTRGMRNPDLSPLISCDGPQGKMAPKLDPPLLESLLRRVYSEVFPYDNLFYTGGGDDTLDSVISLENFSRIFLGKEETCDSESSWSPEDLIVLPIQMDEAINNSTSQSIRRDPLIKSISKEVEESETYCPDKTCMFWMPHSRRCSGSICVYPTSSSD